MKRRVRENRLSRGEGRNGYKVGCSAENSLMRQEPQKAMASPKLKTYEHIIHIYEKIVFLIHKTIIHMFQMSCTNLSISWRITGCHYAISSLHLHKLFLLNIKFWLRRENVVRLYHRSEMVTIHMKGRTHQEASPFQPYSQCIPSVLWPGCPWPQHCSWLRLLVPALQKGILNLGNTQSLQTG